MPRTCEKSDFFEMAVLKPRLSLMRLLLGFGIYFQAPAGISVNRFIREFLDADQDYIDNRIQTMFMDGKAVDDPEKTCIKKDCHIGLSAAMPGVFGAAFRKQGIYSGLRKQPVNIEKEPENDFQTGRPVTVAVRLFNQVAADLGDNLLMRGVCMDAEVFIDFLKRNDQVLEKDCRSVNINHQETAPGLPADKLSSKTGKITVKIKAVDE